jgi:DNA-binding NtrC family response regulator
MLNGAHSLSPHHPSGPTEAAGASVEEPNEFLCISTALRRLLLQAEITAARLQLATLEGEPGTGKQLFARNLHHRSPLAHLPFRRRDAREWLATEVNSSDSTAFSGTLYLDRVDMLAPGGQGLLLNLLKMLPDLAAPSRNKRFMLLTSSHTSLRQRAAQGTFLPDLAFRLTAVRFSLPPLRERREDIAPIAQSLVDRICRRYSQPTAVLAPGTLPRLLQHTWPGNVRELASVLESAILESTTGVISPSNLALTLPSTTETTHAHAGLQPNPLPSDLALDAVIHRHIQLVLELNRGNKLRASRQLGISRSTLYRILGGDTALPS